MTDETTKALIAAAEFLQAQIVETQRIIQDASLEVEKAIKVAEEIKGLLAQAQAMVTKAMVQVH